MPPEISVGNPLALMAESTELHLTEVTLATCSAKRRSHNYSNLQKRTERFVVFYTVVRMNRRSSHCIQAKNCHWPSPPSCGKRRSCESQAALHRRSRPRPPQPTSGRPRGHHPSSLTHNHAWVHTRAGGRDSGGKMGASRSCLKNLHSSV